MIKKITFLVCAGFFVFIGQVANAQSAVFTYTGSVQTWTVPLCVYSITIDCYGAQGVGTFDEFHPGYGGEARGVLAVTPGQVYNIFVGGQTGWNGGGLGLIGANGGDGSDVRYPSTSLADRIIVAGGGGGAGGDNWYCYNVSYADGGGGTPVGTNFVGGGGGEGYTSGTGCGTNGATNGGNGGTGYHGGGGGGGGLSTGGFGAAATGCSGVAASGSLGQGGASFNGLGCINGYEGTGGGGGGYYGGGGAAGCNCGAGQGGGGSSWTGSLTSPYFNYGAWTGNGKVIITYGGFSASISSQSNPTCGICNGSITAGTVGGVTPYTYSWSPGGQTTQTATGLCPGTYTVVIADSCGNTASTAVTLVNLTLTVNTIVTANEKCYGNCIGSASAIASGSVPPYTYTWTPYGGTTDTATGLCVGTYTILASDINGCTGSATITITQPTPLTLNTTMTAATCGLNSGTTTAIVGGGTSPYTYVWSPSAQTTAMATGLSGGTYTVTVEDINGCSATSAIFVTSTGQVTVSIGATTDVLCYGGNNGNATAVVTGSSPFIYLWTPGNQTTQTATGLIAGTYTVSVIDANDCTGSATVTITQPSKLTASATGIVGPTCFGGNNGLASVSAGGGTSPYTYSWSPGGQTTITATGLSARTYTITVTDINGCTATTSATVTQPSQVTASITSKTNVSCFGGSNGSITVVAGGGTSPYVYLWSPGGQTAATATGLGANTYTVIITDNNGCTASASATLTQPILLTANITANTGPSCFGGNNGNATVTAGGGISPYTYSWSPSAQSTATATGLSAQTYVATVTDNHGCTTTASITITQPTLLTATASVVKNVLCYGGNNGTAIATATGGTPAYTYSWSPSGGTNATGTGMTAGVYTVTITDKNACTTSTSVTISQPVAVLTATATAITNIGCYNGNNGSATVTPVGGTSPYTYLWTPSAITSATANNLFAVSYTITVTDAHGCTTTATVTLTQPTQISATISEPKLICKDSTGNLVTNATGGTSPYTYHWSTGATSSVAIVTPINTNNYSVTVTDANGCTATAQIILQYGPAFSVDVKGKNSICAGDSTTMCADVAGALDGVSYLWEPANSTNACIIVEPSISSIFTITVIDGCGSTTSATTEIYTVPSPNIKISANINQGCYPLCVQFRNATTISQGSIGQYVWTFGNGDTSHASNPIYCYTYSGQYNVTLTATSDSGCSATFSNIGMISVYAHPDAAFTYSPQNATVETPTIQFTDESSDASGIIYRRWGFGDATDSVSSLANPVHTYWDTGRFCPTLVVMNSHGCTDTTTSCLIIAPAYKLYIPSAFTPNADGLNEVFQPKGIYIRTFDMYIFDRWGQPIFHTSNINQGWNGEVNGSGAICQEDTYIYKITVTDSEGNLHSYVGNVTLIK